MDSFDALYKISALEKKWVSWATGKGHEPGTLRSYLGSLATFMQFIIREKTMPNCKYQIPCTITLELMNVVLVEVKNWSKSFHDECEDRQWEVMEKDLRNMIKPEEVMKVYHSLYAQTARQKLAWPTHRDTLTRSDYVLVRDYLASIACLCNAQRAGAVANMSLKEFMNAVPGTGGDIIINVRSHKTSRWHGPAQVVFTTELFSQMKVYEHSYRQVVVTNNKHITWTDENPEPANFFLTWGYKPLDGFSKQLDSFWKKALGTNRTCPVSATLARKSVVTLMYEQEHFTVEEKSNLAKQMKHKPETAATYYNLQKQMKSSTTTTRKIDSVLFDDNSELTEKLNVDVEQVNANLVTYSSIHSDNPPGVPECSMKPSIDTHSTDFCVSKNRWTPGGGK